MKSKVTLKDIAREVGVAEMTVSSALRNVGRVGKETRQKIIEVADKLGYRPNTAAQSMRSGRFNCLALLISQNHPTPITINMLNGIENVMAKNNLHLILSQLADEKVTDKDYMPQILRQSMADGLLIKYDIYIPNEMIRILKQNKYNIPAIWINSKHKTDCIYADEIDAGRQATKYLIDMGHRNIWYLTYTTEQKGHYSIEDRFKGYKKIMTSAGLQPNWLGKNYDILSREMRLELIQQILKTKKRPTAIVTNNATTANISILAATMLNIKIPDELSIITFNEEPFDNTGMPIDTMIIPSEKIGTKAVEMLLQKIDNPSIVFPAHKMKYSLNKSGSCIAL